MKTENNDCFKNALPNFPISIQNVLKCINEKDTVNIQEIRLRSFNPLSVTKNSETLFVDGAGNLGNNPLNSYVVTDNEVKETYRLICAGSVYSHINEIKDGFVILKHGNRAGICGTFTDEGILSDITSVNIRIARQIFGSAKIIAENYKGGGVLIAGPPGSGKTTMLRDFIRILSSGERGKFYRVCVIDKRGELSAAHSGRIYNDLGPNTDVYLGVENAKGIEMAIRTMYPDIAAFDEISTIEQANSIIDSFNAGVDIVTTAHIFTESDLLRRAPTIKLLDSGAIKTVVILPFFLNGQIKIMSPERLKLKCFL